MPLLLVHDEAAVRRMLAEALQSAGLGQIHEANGSDEAVGVANDLPELDTLIVRANMPGGGGVGLHTSLRYRFPDLRVAYLGESSNLPENTAHFADPPDLTNVVDWALGGGTVAPGSHPRTLGGYALRRLIADSGSVLTFEATQESVSRPVALRLLKPELSGDPDAVKKFHRLVRAQAALVHQHVAPVFEAREEGSFHFYTGEMVPGRNLLTLAEAGERFGDDQILNALRVTGEAMTHMSAEGIHRRRFRAPDIYFDENGATRLVNIAIAEESGQTSQARDIQTLVSNLQPLARAGTAGDLLQRLADADDPAGRSWESLLAATAEARKTVRRQRAARSTGAGATATRLLGSIGAKKMGGLAAALAIAVAAIALLFIFVLPSTGKPEVRTFNRMVRVAAGNFPSGIEGLQTRVETFWIDEYEVTIAQYSAFLESIESADTSDFSHDDQPSNKTSHRPANWEAILEAAENGDSYQGGILDPNCPVFGVDWWDAYTYARWSGRRLPTDVEWEKAARGREGNRFPWGNKPSPESANTGADYESAGGGGDIDGYNLWAAVDAHPTDVSPFGVFGMGGNVEEWTDSRVDHPNYPDRLVPTARGTSFASKKGRPLTTRIITSGPEESGPARGFRTASSTAPQE